MFIGAMQAVARRADVLHLPRRGRGSRRRRVRKRARAAARSRLATARRPRGPSCCRNCGRRWAPGRQAPCPERTKAVMLGNPTTASTGPLAALRSPRRASGLNSGSMRLRELDEELELLSMLRLLGRTRLASHRLLEQHPVPQHQRVEGLEIDEQHAAFERRQRPAPQAGAAGKVDVEAVRRRRLQASTAAAGTTPPGARRSIRVALARGCRDRRAARPGASGTGARSSWGRPSGRAGAARVRCAARRRA